MRSRFYIEDNPKKGATYEWRVTNRRYHNFTDLGDYVLECAPYVNFNFERANKYVEERCDIMHFGACSALGTKTDDGDVIIGRNLDLTVSQFPCYISHVNFGKYETLNFTYDEMSNNRYYYDDLLSDGKIDDDYYNAIPLFASDSMNSEGLYMQYNMRGYEEQFKCLGTNPTAKTRICSISLPFMVASHCRTVPEALKYMRDELDIYTLADDSAASGWNLCMMIGDAEGHYGLIEIANDEIKYLPYQHGQGNYYIYPAFNCISQGQSGYGRLQYGLERIDKVQSDEDMAKLMENIMWRYEILRIPYAYRDDNGHIHFCKDEVHNEESLDWRSDNVHMIPVNEAGKYVDVDDDTDEARLVREYKRCHDDYLLGIDMYDNKAGFEKYKEYLSRHSLVWAQTDENFEDLQRGLIKHYTENGKFEKLRRYYLGDEEPLRDDGEVFTTALSLSVNCTKRRLTVRFWEKPKTVMHYQW